MKLTPCTAWATLLIMWAVISPSRAQAVLDTLYTWRSYAEAGTCRVHIHRIGTSSERRSVVVIQEIADNRGPTTLRDAPFLVEGIGRTFAIDPEEATWIFHWGSFSYPNAAGRPDKHLFLRARFKRSVSGTLNASGWRPILREDVEALTDRQYF